MFGIELNLFKYCDCVKFFTNLDKHNFCIKSVNVTFIIGRDIAVGTRSLTRKD